MGGSREPVGAGPPVELGVALVGGDDHAVAARPPHHLGEVLDPEHPAGRVRRGVEPQQLRGGAGVERPERGDGVDRHRAGAREAGTDVVGGVGDPGVRHDVSGTEPEKQRQPGHELLGADRRHHPGRVDPRHTSACLEPRRDRLAQVGGAVRLRVAGSVGGAGQRVADHGGRGVDRRADREVDDAAAGRAVRTGVGKGARPLLGRSERVPGEVGEAEHRPTRRAPAVAGRR